MPVGVPPKGVRPFPRYHWLPAGTFLWRVTGAPAVSVPSAPPAPPAVAGSPSLAPTPFAPTPFAPAPSPTDPPGSHWGRFHPTPDCPYPYCYAALDELTALCETLLRDVSFNAPVRLLPRATVRGQSLELLETRRPLALVSLLDAADLAAARQDTWLVQTEEPNYPVTRLWAHWLRDALGPDGAGPPAGLVWPSKRQPTGRAVLLFGDRCGDALVRSSFGARRLDDEDGLAWLNRRLHLLRTGVDRPAAS